MRIVRWIIRSGIREGMSYQRKRSVLISNYLSLILCFALFVILLFRTFIHQNATVQIHWIIGTALFALPVFLNRANRTNAGKMLLCFGSLLFVWYSFVDNMNRSVILEVSQFDGLRVYILALSFMPYLLFSKEQFPLLVTAILPSVVSVIFFDQIFYLLHLSLDRSVTDGSSDYPVMWMRTIVAYMIISAGCIAFQAIISHNDRMNQTLLERIKSNLEKIEEQNKELTQQRNKLSAVNDHLGELVESKTSKIRQQNETLLKLAFTNAHKVRGPVARILGLISVSRLHNRLDYSQLFNLVESETIGIDKILHEVSGELDRTVSEGEPD